MATSRDPAKEFQSAAGDRPPKLRAWEIMLLISPGLLFILVDAVFFLQGLVDHSFALIKTIYNFNTLVAPILFGLSAVIALAFGRGPKRSKTLMHAFFFSGALIVLSLGLRVYATHIEPKRFVLRTVVIKTGKVDRAYRIVHISDIQSDAVGDHEARVFNRIRALRPDLILHTGDLLQPLPPASLASEIPKLAALFRTLSPPLGMYSVFGDADDFIGKLAPEALGGLRMLESQDITLPLGKGHLKIFGLSLYQSMDGRLARPALERWISRGAATDFTLVMGHRPDYALFVSDIPFDICLAGHTHGGQIRVPFFGPISVLSKIPRSLGRGYHSIGKTRLNVSAGIGSEHAAGLPAIRVNCPPEMTLIELAPE